MLNNLLLRLIIFSFIVFPYSVISGDFSDIGTSIKSDLSGASFINVKHLPNILIERQLLELCDVKEKWSINATIRCLPVSGGCSERVNSKLNKFVQNSFILQEGEKCPNPINTLITLIDKQEKRISEIYIHSGGRCFVYKGKSYHSEVKLDLPNDLKYF